MPGRYYGRKRSFIRPIITSVKNVVVASGGTDENQVDVLIAKAVNSPVNTVSTDVSIGCIIKAFWLVIDACGIGGTGVLNIMGCYVIKNPGDNLTEPGSFAVGTSNEKKFVFKQWQAMIMRNQDGNTPYHWEGWVKIPKRYQRMGTDDTIRFLIESTTALDGHFSIQAIYKWYR